MKLYEYDDKCVRITLKDGSVVEGACLYDCAEYCEIELGINEECLEISGWLFNKSDISKIELVDEKNPFLAPFGIIETETVKDGADTVKDILLDGDPRNAERLLNCMENYIVHHNTGSLPDRSELIDALNTAAEYAQAESVKKRSRNLAETLKSRQ